MRDTHNSLKIEKSFHIDLVVMEQLGVITEVAEKPAELPESLLSTVQTSNESLLLNGFGFQDNKTQFEKRLLRLPAEESTVDSNKEETLEKVPVIGLPRMKARDMADHELTSWVRA
jgi:hypothetical protein